MSGGSEEAIYSSPTPAATRRDFPFIPTLSFHRLHSLPISEAGETDQIDDFGERAGLAETYLPFPLFTLEPTVCRKHSI